jgi:ubiquinone biosynthesis protein COQ4
MVPCHDIANSEATRMQTRTTLNPEPAVALAPGAPLRRQWRHGLRSLWRFVTTPSDLANSFEAMFALAGPTIDKEFRKFAEHPTGRAMLAERPRRDLNALLSDRAALAAMPPDSFAAAYLVYLGGEDMGSADYFLEAADLDEKARRFGWSEDQLWFVKRMANSHDLFHVVAGYDRDVTGEIGVVSYTAGQIPLLPLRLLLPYLVALKPSEPIRWVRYVRDAYRHGRRTPSLGCVDYEAILPLPLAEARRAIGVPTMQEAHPRGIPEKGWLLDRVERNVSLV